MSWVLLSIVAGFAWAIVNVIDKVVFVRWKLSPEVFFLLISIAFFLSGVVMWPFLGFPIPPQQELLLAGISGCLYFLCFVFYYRALKNEEVSRVVPLWYLSPLFIIVFAALFLGERLTYFHIGGVVLLVFGAMTVTARGLFSRPRWGVLGLMIAADILFAASAVIGKQLMDGGMDLWTYYALSRVAGIVVVVPALILLWQPLCTAIRTNGMTFLWVIGLEELLNVGGDIAWLLAIGIGSATLATALSSSQPFFVLLIVLALGHVAPRLLDDEVGTRALAQKAFSIASIIVGAILVTS
ncbi:MAG: EamA family transporter [Patescibacteria group bacterium]